MNILWITNGLMPDIANRLGVNVNGSGGWMQSSLDLLRNQPNINIAVACAYPLPKYTEQEINGIKYYVLPYNNPIFYNSKLEKYWMLIKSDFKPDLVHIHGSEFPLGLSYVRSCGNGGVIVSIQGMISEISKFKFAGLSTWQIFSSWTVYDLFHFKYIPLTIYAFHLRAKYERELISKVKNVIGRTTWDHSHCVELNNEIQYFKLNEMLRPCFYNSTWNYETCQKHSIFVSQVYTPIKGLHYLIKAVMLIKKNYPDVIVYVAGNDIINVDKKHIRGYGKLCRNLMLNYGVLDNFHFTGLLSAEQMKEYYLKSNVYVCCSSIENSPNSLCEAQILGTPVVSSFVGGTPDFVEHKKNGFLYRSEDSAVLAHYINYIFSQGSNIKSISDEGRIVAKERHKVVNYTVELLNIYNSIK